MGSRHCSIDGNLSLFYYRCNDIKTNINKTLALLTSFKSLILYLSDRKSLASRIYISNVVSQAILVPMKAQLQLQLLSMDMALAFAQFKVELRDISESHSNILDSLCFLASRYASCTDKWYIIFEL